MLRRVLIWGVRSYVGGPAKSWVFTSAALGLYRLVRSVRGRREIVDLSSIKPGQKIVIEHLPISHKKQIREFRRTGRAERRAAKRAARQG